MPYVKRKSSSKNKNPMRKAPSKFNYVRKTGNLAKDVAKLKRQVNKTKPEVKFTDMTPSSVLCGQVTANLTGANGFFIPLTIGTGNANGGRIGNSVKCIGHFLRMQLTQQSALAIGVKYIIDVWKTDDINSSIAALIPLCYEADSITGVVDTNSSQNLHYRKIYKKIKTKVVYLPADATSSVNLLRDIKLFVKQRQILEWPDTTGTSPMNMNYFVIIRASAGNHSTTTASTNPLVQLKIVNTGAQLSYVCKSYYTDN